MDTNKILLGKRVLVVDDERDVLDLITDLLRMCTIDAADSFEEAKALLETQPYDIAVLDIMGVTGFGLLKIAISRNIPALMLTAKTLCEESLDKTINEGASYFVPKDKISQIDTYVADVLESIAKNKNPWSRWVERLGDTPLSLGKFEGD
jgi:CheY-like chemotaxis protein